MGISTSPGPTIDQVAVGVNDGGGVEVGEGVRVIGGVGVFSRSMIVGIGDVGSGGVVVTGLGMVEPEHAVSAMVRVRYIQEDSFNVENLR